MARRTIILRYVDESASHVVIDSRQSLRQDRIRIPVAAFALALCDFATPIGCEGAIQSAQAQLNTRADCSTALRLLKTGCGTQ